MAESVTSPEATGWTLPARYYTDPGIFALERERIFLRSWLYVGHESQVAEPGGYLTYDLYDQGVAVVRGMDGTLRGFHNVCQHRAHRLLEGRGRTPVITCPYHAWAYGLDGALRTARGSENVPGFDRTGFCLKPVQVESFLGFIMINFDLAAPPFASQAEGLADQIRDRAPWLDELTLCANDGFRSGEDVACNWKVLLDNCTECYHCAPTHPAFVDLVDIETYRIEPGRLHTMHTAQCTKPANAAYDYAPNAPVRGFTFWHVWPNITFGIMPGTENFLAFAMDPVAPTRCLARGQHLRKSGAPRESDQAREDYGNNVLWPEDKAIVESVQRGLASRGYDRGRFILDPDRHDLTEFAAMFFQARIRAALEG
ncbi:MAG: aromatic ring-hydroxylating dioxygenase subunit alpha [Alphaproteobacteria bacterium]